MYGPGFFTAKLIAKYGTFAVAFIGTVVYTFSLLVGVFSIELWAFFVEMIFLGLAWNLSFTAGTVMLTSCYPPEYTTACQGLNDVFVFGVSGVLAICSSIIVEKYGWNVQIFLCFALLACFILMFAIAYNAKLVVKDKEEKMTQRESGGKTALPENSGIHPDVLAQVNSDDEGDPEENPVTYKKSVGTSIRPSAAANSQVSRQSNAASFHSSRITLAGGNNARQTMSRLTLTGGLAQSSSRKSMSQRFFTNEGMDKDVMDSLMGEQDDESVTRASMGGW
jgi:MFS family permease